MTSPAVVEHLNIISDVFSSVLSGLVVGKKDSLSFQTTKKALCHGIIPAIPFAAHAADHTVRCQHGLKFKATVLTAPIDMYIKTRSEGFGNEAKRRILLGAYCLSTGYYDAYYLKAQKVRTKIREDFDKAFKECDCIITPTSPTPAFRIGEKMDDPLSMYLSDIYTIPANLAGLPAMSIPCGFSKEGLPIGMQILAKAFDEETIFRAAYTFEQNTEFHKKRPKL